MPLSIILYAIFGYLGIYFSNKIEFLKNKVSKKILLFSNLLIASLANYELQNAEAFRDEDWKVAHRHHHRD